MLIDTEVIKNRLKSMNINVKGVLHIGAHDCEELPFYISLGVDPKNCIWIDAIQEKVEEGKRRGTVNLYQAVISDKDDTDVQFNVSNNIQSSSIFPLGTHEKNYNWVHYTHQLQLKTTTIDTFFSRNNLDASNYNFWNFDIQGAELNALKGAQISLKWPDVIYLEVNTEEVYKGCGLREDIDRFLGEKGFSRFETILTNAGWGDALYIRTD